MHRLRKAAAVAVVAAVTGALLVTVASPATAAVTDVWTEPAGASVFKDSTRSAYAGTAVRLDMARNEFEAGQIVLRRDENLVIHRVSFGPLTGGGNTIAAANLSYNFVGYQFLNNNSAFDWRKVYPTLRPAPDDFPDRLTNDTGVTVSARTTQSVWVRVFAPIGQAPGIYNGTVTVETDKGNLTVPLSVNLRGVTLPNSKDSRFNVALWQLLTGNISWDEGAGDTVRMFYEYDRYSPQWWTLMDRYAKMMRDYRLNDLAIPLVRSLIEGGSRPNGAGGYTFNWSRFDEVVEFMMARNAVKRLEGFWEAADTTLNGPQDGVREIEVIRLVGGVPRRAYVRWDSAEATGWMNSFFPALRDHIRAKGWESIFWMHVADEPFDNAIAAYRGIGSRMRSHWPNVKIGDAFVDFNAHTQVMDLTSVMIPLEDTHDANLGYYEARRQEGRELWIYNCIVPMQNYLNRFIDQPQWHSRLTFWYAYRYNVTGYLHWAMSNWQFPMNDQLGKGDGFIVRPDKTRNTLEASTRLEALRDGLEEYELLTLVEATNPGLAKTLADALVKRADKYTMDVAYMARIRTILLDTAAGLPVVNPDRALNKTATASSQLAGSEAAKAVDGNAGTAWQPQAGTSHWIQVNLQQQHQIDGVLLQWGAPHAANYKVQVSYDGIRFTDVHSTTTGDGGTDFVGVNGKGAVVRIEVAGAAPVLSALQVAGAPLAKANLVGGRNYTLSAAPDNQPDSGFEATDGVLADEFTDGRSFGYAGSAGQTRTVDVTFDLGGFQPVNTVKVHTYEEYPAYRPTSVRVSTSLDGVNFTQRGQLGKPNGPSAVWFDFTFPTAPARFVRVSYTKTFDSDGSVMLLDDVEVYGAAANPSFNLARSRPYTKSVAPDPAYPDTGNVESADGLIAGPYSDGRGYGYYLPTDGQTLTLDVTLDLGVSRALGQVNTRKFDDGVHDYAADTVRVYAGDDPANLTLRGETSTATGLWFHVPVSVTARYVRVQFVKLRDHGFADYLFVDEIEAIGANPAAAPNLALNRPYTNFVATDPAYPDTGGREATDGAIAGGYDDGLGFGFRLATPGAAVTVNLTVDLGTTRPVGLVRVARFDDGAHDYDPDNVKVMIGDTPTTLVLRGEVGTPVGQWFELVIPPGVSGRYVRVQATKTRAHDFADYLFLDEVAVF